MMVAVRNLKPGDVTASGNEIVHVHGLVRGYDRKMKVELAVRRGKDIRPVLWPADNLVRLK